MQSPGMQYPPLSAPTMDGRPGGQPLPPPPAAGTRQSWPAPPGAQLPAGSGEPPLSDTLERMLRPQGLFQNRQPAPVDWQQQAWNASGNGYQPGGAAGAGYPAPGQYGQDQYGQDQYGQGQYGQDQYGQGQYGQDQYGQGQYAQGPYGPGKYGSQYPPSGQLPFGGQFGPGQGAPGRNKKLLPVAIAAVLAIIIAGAIGAVVLSGHGSGSAGAGGTTTPTASAKSSKTGTAANPAEKTAATELSALLAQSGTDRSDVNAAYDNVASCGKNLSADARVFTRSATNRETLLTKLGTLPDRSALPAAMLGDLTRGWQASASVDRDLAKWATSAATRCHKGNLNDPNLVASGAFETPASTNKAAFVKLWNPMARRYGLGTVTVDSL